MKNGRKHYLIVVSVLSIVCSPILLEIGMTLVRGYGFFGMTSRMMRMPYYECIRDLRPLEEFYNEHYEREYDRGVREIRRPQPEDVHENVSTLSLAPSQPYTELGVWILRSETHDCRYLYTPLPAQEDDQYWSDPNYYSRVNLCTLSQWEGPEGIYHPYRKYPDFVRDHIQRNLGGEQWVCWISLSGYAHFSSSLPPVPGALILEDQLNGSSLLVVKYPEEVVPIVRAIYPNLMIPREAILER